MVNVNKSDEKIRRDLVLYHEHTGRHDGGSDHTQCRNKKQRKKPFYKLKLDEMDSEYSGTNVNMPHIRDQRLAKYV